MFVFVSLSWLGSDFFSKHCCLEPFRRPGDLVVAVFCFSLLRTLELGVTCFVSIGHRFMGCFCIQRTWKKPSVQDSYARHRDGELFSSLLQLPWKCGGRLFCLCSCFFWIFDDLCGQEL